MKFQTIVVEVKSIVKMEEKASIVNLRVLQPVKKFVKDDGERKLVESKEVAMHLSEFKGMFAANPETAALEPIDDDDLMKAFAIHRMAIKGATLSINKEEVTAPQVDDKGNEVEGSSELVKFGETTYDVKFTKQGLQIVSMAIEKQIAALLG